LSPDQTRRLTQFPLRLAKSLREAADATAREQGISLNHFIALAVAEKIERVEVTSSPKSGLSETDDGITP
jgi:predicted HicB family RNase H-like nuclease